MTVTPYIGVERTKANHLLARGSILHALGPHLDDLVTRHELGDKVTLVALEQFHAFVDCEVDGIDHVEATYRGRDALLAAWTGAGSLLEGLPGDAGAQMCAALQYVEPVDVVGQAWRTLTAVAADCYAASWPAAVELQLATLGHPPRDDRFAVSGSTKRGASVTVTLKIQIRRFGPWSLAAVWSVLAHELIAHAGAQQGLDIDEASPWAEGVMDWAASVLLLQHLRQDPSLFAAHLRVRHEEFYGLSGRFGDVDAAVARQLGRRVADRLCARLTAHHGYAPGVADLLVARWATRFNATPKSLLEKDELVYELDDPVAGPVPDELLEAITG